MSKVRIYWRHPKLRLVFYCLQNSCNWFFSRNRLNQTLLLCLKEGFGRKTGFAVNLASHLKSALNLFWSRRFRWQKDCCKTRRSRTELFCLLCPGSSHVYECYNEINIQKQKREYRCFCLQLQILCHTETCASKLQKCQNVFVWVSSELTVLCCYF